MMLVLQSISLAEPQTSVKASKIKGKLLPKKVYKKSGNMNFIILAGEWRGDKLKHEYAEHI